MSPRMPTVYIPHGGGPWPFMDLAAAGLAGAYDGMAAYLRALAKVPPQRPAALLVISAHWEASKVTVQSAARPPMLYDYSGFPPETYEVQWPAPGAPALAERARGLLEAAGLATAADDARGFDHGTYVPLALAYPEADLPTFQISLLRRKDPAEHLALGRALAPLRDEGVFIIGSGMSYHNLNGFFGQVPTVREDSQKFDAWLRETCLLPAAGRDAGLTAWAKAPRARACHPREEHLLPLMVVAGAAGDDPAHIPYQDVVMNAHLSAVQFGT